jgi:hypothetical protein
MQGEWESVKSSASRCWLIYTFSVSPPPPRLRICGFCYTVCLSLCIYIYVSMWIHLDGASTVGRILFMFGIQELNHLRFVTHEYEHSNSKPRSTYMVPKHIMAIFLKTAITFWMNFNNLWRPHPQTELHGQYWDVFASCEELLSHRKSRTK